MVQNEQAAIGRGLTWKTVLAIIFSSFIIQPAVMYLYLVSGQWLPFQAWIVILLWTQLARLLGSPLTKEETFIITALGGITGALGGLTGWWGALPMTFLTPIRYAYIRSTEYPLIYGLAHVIPDWWAPNPAIIPRLYLESWVLLDPALLMPILLNTLMITFNVMANISIGYFAYALYVRVQKLEFPAATAEARTVLTLAEREPTTLRVLMLSAIAGVIINIVRSFVPNIIYNILGGGGVVIPQVIDLTRFLVDVLPGATYTISINPMHYVAGFLLPSGVAVAQFLGSIAYYFIGTYAFTSMNLWPPEVNIQAIKSWESWQILDRSVIYFFISIHIGLSLATIVIPFLLHPSVFRRLVNTLKEMRAVGEVGGRMPSPYLLLGIFFLATLGSISLNLFLIPDIVIILPLILAYTIGWSFFASFVATFSAGVTYGSLNIPYQKELLIHYSGFYNQVILFAPIQVFQGGGDIAQALRGADICGVKHSDYVKAFVLVAVLGLLSSFLFVNLFWSIQPFPSQAYPYTVTGWVTEAAEFVRNLEWTWTGRFFDTTLILGSFTIGSIVYAVMDLVFHAPWFLISFISGGFWWNAGGVNPIAWSQALLIGSLLGSRLFSPIIGKENWYKYRSMIVVGFMLGDGMMNTLYSAIFLMKRSVWLLPY
ncbi:MAG: hypothetical protein QXT14_03875 [Candidatus Bathyarchaeia archaeon]